MNPYAYQQPQLQPQQQYQYQAQFAQPQHYYYVQPPAPTTQPAYQSATQPYATAQYGTVGYQNPQAVGVVGQYQVQGYAQVPGTQQYVIAGQNYYAPAAQTNQGLDQTHQPPNNAVEEAPPPLPPEQSHSSAPPPLPPEPTPTNTSTLTSAPGFSGSTAGGDGTAEQALEVQKQYQEKYAQWQQQYAQWQAQHQHHPDQKQYQEWQKQMEKWQQQNQNLIQQQAATVSVPTQDQGQAAAQLQQPAVQPQQHQQIAYQGQEQQSRNQTQPYEQQLYLQQQQQQSQPQWLHNTSSQMQQGEYNKFSNQKHEKEWMSQVDQQENSSWSQEELYNETKQGTMSQGHQLPKWMQSGKAAVPSNSQGPRWMQSTNLKATGSQQDWPAVSNNDSKKLPQWLQQGTSTQQRTAEKTPRQQQAETDTPRWLQEKLEKTERDVKQAAAERALKENETQNKQLPRWMQENRSNSREVPDSQGRPQNQTQQKPLPKWLQEKPSSAGNQSEDRKNMGQVPKWLQANTSATPMCTTQTAPTAASPVPQWLQANTSATLISTTQTAKTATSPAPKKPSKWDQDDRATSSTTVTINAKKLDPLKEIELLRQQQEQLQKLQQLEKRLKQTSSPSSTVCTVSTSSSINSSQTDTATFSSWSRDGYSNQSTQPSNKPQASGSAENLAQQKSTKPACKFFPNCRFGRSCHFQHPPCKLGPRCNRQDCISDHGTDSVPVVEEYAEESHDQYPELSLFADDPGSYSSSMSKFSSRVDQIPGIGDGEMPVVPAQTDNSAITGDTSYQPEDNSYQIDNNYEVSQEDYMDIEDDQNEEENTIGVTTESESFTEDTLQSVAEQGNKSGEEWQESSQHDHHWSHGGDWSGPRHHQEEHSNEGGTWGMEKPAQGSEWQPHGERFSRWEGEEGHPSERDSRPPVPREGDNGGSLDRKEWRPALHEWGSRPPFPRDDREFGPGRHERDRRPPFLDGPGRRPAFPPDERGRRPPWGNEHDGRYPFPGDDRDRPPFGREERGRPPFPRGEWVKDRPPFPRDAWDGRPPLPKDRDEHQLTYEIERDAGPPASKGEADHKPAASEMKAPSLKEEKSQEEEAMKQVPDAPPENDRPPFLKDDKDRLPFPADERDRPPFFRDDRDSRPPFPRDERDREPFARHERDQPPFLRDDRGRPPFPRDEWDYPPFPRDEWDRPPFSRGDIDFPFPPRGGRDRWPPPPRDERDRWAPFPRDDRNMPEWERGRGPPGRPSSPRGRSGRGRPPFHEDDRVRRRSPPAWPLVDHPHRAWSPPARDYRGRPPPPPEEFDRFGRPPPPPPPPHDADFFDDRGIPPRDWDRDRGDWRRPPPDEEWRRDPRYPDDRRPRSPPPHWDHHPDHFPPRHSRDWERDERRGPDDRWYDERGPPDRRPPHDDFYQDRPPYPEDHHIRDPAAYPPHPDDVAQHSDPPRVEKKPETVPVESILDSPGRESRPDRIVIILRGPPGSGKTHVARLIKDKEVSHGAHAPRILALDDYFLVEVEKSEQDPDTGKKMKKKVTEYVYEEEMEEAYRSSLFKSFSKTLEDGFFPVVIVDAIHDKVGHFEKYWSHAKQKGFEVYVAELMADAHACAKRNSHNRTFEEINKMVAAWEETPAHHLRLDVRSMLQDAVITEVEMETADETDGAGAVLVEEPQPTEEVEEEPKIQVPSRSKWEDIEPAEDKLNKLDGIRPMKGKRRREESPPFPLSDDDDPYDEREEDMRIGKKRVRWADLEEKKQLEHRRRIGFCIGTDWSLLTDPHAEIPRM